VSLRLTPFLSPREIADLVARLGEEISAAHPEGVVLVGLLKDSAIFLADLIRAIRVDCVVDFIALSAYHPGERRVRVMKDLDLDVAGRAVVLVREIVDTGLSVRYALGLLESREAKSVQLCALLDRRERHILPLEADYLGVGTDDRFLVGYGLDLSERYRNLPGLLQVDPAALDADPEAAAAAIYGAGRAFADMAGWG
jgi:hypoxanthine phosphoribosyltransferase